MFTRLRCMSLMGNLEATHMQIVEVHPAVSRPPKLHARPMHLGRVQRMLDEYPLSFQLRGPACPGSPKEPIAVRSFRL